MVSQSTSESTLESTVDDISVSPNTTPVQPVLKTYPEIKGRRFSCRYYDAFQWLEYSIKFNAVFCFCCRHFAPKSIRPGETFGNRTFIEKGFCKWKDAASLLKQHDLSERHKHAVLAWSEFKNRSKHKQSVSSLLNATRFAEIEENRAHVKAILRAISFLGRQGLAFRGHDESIESGNRGNLKELLETFAEENPNLKEKLIRRYGHYTSPDYQNDMIDVFGNKIQSTIIKEIQTAKYFSLLADETKDLSKSEQLAILIRYVDITGNVSCIKEKAVDLHHLKNLNAESLTFHLTTNLKKIGLDLSDCVGQCYDGASVMSGKVNGVQARIKNLAPHATYVHCHAHRLNLALVDTLDDIIKTRDFFIVVQNLYNYIANSSPRHEKLVAVQQRLGQKVLNLERTVPTRWFYWFRSIQKIKKRYAAILEVLQDESNNSAEAVGLQAQVTKPVFIFYLHAMETLLGTTYNLSEQLQAENLDICSAISLLDATRSALENARSEETFESILGTSKQLATTCGFEWTRVQRKRVLTKKLSDSYTESTVGHRDGTDDIDFRKEYYAVVDRFLVEFGQRFSENNQLLYSAFKFLKKEDTFSFLEAKEISLFLQVYGHLVDEPLLHTQLPLAKIHLLKSLDSGDCTQTNSALQMLDILKNLPVAYSEVIKILKIICTLPVTTASDERFFSVLKRVKNYLRTTMGDERLRSLMLMASEPNLVKGFDLNYLVDEFAAIKHRRYPLTH